MLNIKHLKLLAYGIVSLMLAYWSISMASESIDWFGSAEGMTIGIIGVFSGAFLGMLWLFKP